MPRQVPAYCSRDVLERLRLGVVMDSEREESIRQHRLAAQIQRLAQLCIPIPDAAILPQSGTPRGCWPGRRDRSRSPPLQAGRQRQLLPVEAAAGSLPQSTVHPDTLPSLPQANPVGELVTSRSASHSTEEYARILKVCSTFLEGLAREGIQPHPS